MSDSPQTPAYDPKLKVFLDKAELRDLALRYARAIDRRDRELLLSCYHEDAIDHHGTMFRDGPIAYADWQPEVMAPFELTAHYLMNTDYRLDGDRAEGELYFIAYHRTHAQPRKEAIVGGRYHDRYERRAGEWRIAHRTIVWDFARENLLDVNQFAFLRSLGDVGAGADDASFRTLSLFGMGAVE